MPQISRVTGKFPVFPDHVHAYIIEFEKSVAHMVELFSKGEQDAAQFT